MENSVNEIATLIQRPGLDFLLPVMRNRTSVYSYYEGGGVATARGSAGSPVVAVAALSRMAGPEDRDQHAHQPVEKKWVEAGRSLSLSLSQY